MDEINEQLEKLKIGCCTKPIREDLKKETGDMTFSEESRCAMFEMGKWSCSLGKSSAIVQCQSCLKTHARKNYIVVSVQIETESTKKQDSKL